MEEEGKENSGVSLISVVKYVKTGLDVLHVSVCPFFTHLKGDIAHVVHDTSIGVRLVARASSHRHGDRRHGRAIVLRCHQHAVIQAGHLLAAGKQCGGGNGMEEERVRIISSNAHGRMGQQLH